MAGLFRWIRKRQAPISAESFEENTQLENYYGAILLRFRRPTKIHTSLMQSMWEEHLGVKYESIINAFIEAGELRPLTPEESLQLATVNDLKKMLAGQGLKVSGKKPQLIERLLKDSGREMDAEAMRFSKDSYALTDLGYERIRRYEELLEQYMKRVRSLIRESKLREACKAAEEYRQVIPPPVRGGMVMGEDDEGLMYMYLPQVEYLMESASSSWVVQEIPEDLREEFIYLSIESILLPDRDLEFRAAGGG